MRKLTFLFAAIFIPAIAGYAQPKLPTCGQLATPLSALNARFGNYSVTWNSNWGQSPAYTPNPKAANCTHKWHNAVCDNGTIQFFWRESCEGVTYSNTADEEKRSLIFYPHQNNQYNIVTNKFGSRIFFLQKSPFHDYYVPFEQIIMATTDVDDFIKLLSNVYDAGGGSLTKKP